MTHPALGRWSPEIERWWGRLSQQEQIVWALQATEDDGFPDGPVSIAQNPWKWAIAAYYLNQREAQADAGQTAIPHEREQEVTDAVAEQLQDFADAGHPDEEELMAEAEARVER